MCDDNPRRRRQDPPRRPHSLRGADVRIVVDKDTKGYEHGADLLQQLTPIAASVELGQALTGKDTADHLDAGFTIDELEPVRPEDVLHQPDAADDTVRPHSWQPVNLIDAETAPPAPPSVLDVFYAGARHVPSGEPEAFKSWIALVACVDEIQAGNAVVYVDFEMGGSETLQRLRALGAPDELIADRFVYVEPTEPLPDPSILADVLELIAERQPTLIVVDSLMGLLELHGLDPNSGVDIERLYRTVVNPLREHGAAIVVLDHLVKQKDARGKFVIGSERKIGVAEVHLTVEVKAPFGRGRTGEARLVTKKDRRGWLARPTAAELTLRSDTTTGRVTWQLDTRDRDTQPPPFRPTHLMQRVSSYLETRTEPVSRTTILADVQGKAQALRIAIDTLISEGHAHATEGPRNASLLTSTKPYREANDTTPSHPVPTPSQDGVATPSPESPTSLEGTTGRGRQQHTKHNHPVPDPVPNTNNDEHWANRAAEALVGAADDSDPALGKMPRARGGS